MCLKKTSKSVAVFLLNGIVSREDELHLLDSFLAALLGCSHAGKAHAALETLESLSILDNLLQTRQDGRQQSLSVARVGLEVSDHSLDRDGNLVLLPAVVVGRHADHLVGNLGLAGQLGLGQDTHVDEISAKGAVHVRLGTGRELGTFHADQGLVAVEVATFDHMALLPDNVLEHGREGISKHGVGNNAVLKEGRGADALGAVNDLRRQDKVAGLELLAQRANGRVGNDGLDTDGLERSNVGTGRDLGGSQVVATAVAGQEGDMETGLGAGNGDGVARLAPWLCWIF